MNLVVNTITTMKSSRERGTQAPAQAQAHIDRDRDRHNTQTQIRSKNENKSTNPREQRKQQKQPMETMEVKVGGTHVGFRSSFSFSFFFPASSERWPVLL